MRCFHSLAGRCNSAFYLASTRGAPGVRSSSNEARMQAWVALMCPT